MAKMSEIIYPWKITATYHLPYPVEPIPEDILKKFEELVKRHIKKLEESAFASFGQEFNNDDYVFGTKHKPKIENSLYSPHMMINGCVV